MSSFISPSRFLLLVLVCYTHAARPKPAFDCQDDKIDAKYHNELCSSDEECFGRFMLCKEGKCQCDIDSIPVERFVGEKGKQMTCDMAPGLNEKCTDTCLRPLTCSEREGAGGSNEKVCLCKEPFKNIEGSCELECKEDEKYQRTSNTCKPRCRANEVLIERECAPGAELDGACQKAEQCRVAFSDCISNKCSCRPGFNPFNGQCMPEKLVCPNGPATMINNKPVPCTPEDFADSSATNQDCPAGSVCQLQHGFQHNSVAFCCPEQPSACPLGLPSNRFFCNPANNTCPYQSHFCHHQPGSKGRACCPKPCPFSDDIYHEGKCYHPRTLGGFCQMTKQCPNLAECQEGRCRCPEGFTEQGSSQYRYCMKKCQPDERLHDRSCHKILSLGASCENKPFLCPSGAFCNKLKVCACRCPFFTLVEDVCAPLPRCPALKQYRVYSGRADSLEMSIIDKGYQPISDADRQKIMDNVTFCTYPPAEKVPKVDAVSDCGAGKYCARYIDNLGMCCKKLETVCPSGKAPTEKRMCKRRDATSCPGNEFCFDYLHTADQNSNEGTMCCPKDGFEDEE